VHLIGFYDKNNRSFICFAKKEKKG